MALRVLEEERELRDEILQIVYHERGHSVERVELARLEERLEHVIGHLIQNAIDAGVPGERVRVAIGVEGGFAVVTVSDRGVGMTPEFVRQRLFKPFQTTKQSGMGIGVYESAQYVSQLGGDIEIDSRAGEGTSVRVRLPRAEGPEIAPDTMAEHVA
jgi:signal transduction histidine kinase